jgi:hypothetical protein
MTSKMFDSGRRFGRHARDTLGERSRNTAASVYDTSRRAGRHARDAILSDRNRSAVNGAMHKVYESSRQAWRRGRDTVLPKLVQSIRRSIDRLTSKNKT